MLRFLRLSTILFVSGFLSTGLFAQSLEVINESPYTPQELIQNVFLGEGVKILSVQYDGDDRSAAFFKGGQQSIGIDQGMVMTTGITVTDGGDLGVAEPGNRQSSENNNSPLTTDPDLRALVGSGNIDLNDITRYTITFQPLSDTISFRYAFASEEYPEYVCSEFNDVFGFFISGPGINGPFSNGAVNLARVPGTGFPVSINTINPGSPGVSANGGDCNLPQQSLNFSQYYRSNFNSTSSPVFDGISTVFTATTPVVACETYTIKLVIADVNDSSWDSGVFLEARSFGGDGAGLEIVNLAIDGTLIEGCQDAALHFYTLERVEEDMPLEVRIFGDATPGTDYNTLPTEYIIPAGDSLLVVPVSAFQDNENDDGEKIRISLRRSECLIDTFDIRIEASRIGESELIDEVTVCAGDALTLDATLTESEPEQVTYTQSEDETFGNLFNPPGAIRSTITVNGFVPEQLGPGIIQSVCINNLENNRPRQISVFLVAPNGNQLELTSRNGGTNNNAPFSGYQNTCFSPDATNRIAQPGQEAPATQLPFTGTWLPEGNFSDLYFGNSPVNGNWELLIIDNSPLTDRTRFGDWSITLERPYQVFYTWDPDANLSCYDCPMPTLTAEDEGWVNVTATDIYGCEVRDSVFVRFPDDTRLDAVNCGMSTDTTLSINWTPNNQALSYEVRTERGTWQNVGLDTDFTFTNLQFDSTYTFFVRGVFQQCAGPSLSVQCRTQPCLTPPTLDGLDFDVSCNGADDGRLELSASGFGAPYRFTVNGTDVNGGIIGDLPPGDYRAIAYNQRGCTDSLSFQISEPAPLTGAIVVEGGVGCNNSATLTATPEGGTGPFSYQWNGSDGAADFVATAAGDFALVITDVNGCTFNTSTTLTAPPPLLAPFTVNPETCTGRQDGSITVNPSGGVPPYAYDWSASGIGDNNVATGLVSGDYEITVTDGGGCSFVVETSVGRGPDVQLTGDFTGVSCNGGSDASITLSVSQATNPLIFDWTGSNSITNVADGLTAGEYEVRVTDDRGCQATTSFSITEPTALIGEGTLQQVLCFGDNTGGIDWTIAGGTPPYNYQWSNGITNPDPGDLSAGLYSLEVTDANGCRYGQDFLIEQNAPLTAEFSVDPVTCAGGTNGAVTVSAGSGTPPYTYQWTGNGATSPSLNNLSAAVYEVSITDANGCGEVLNAEVSEPAALLAEGVTENIRCFGERSGLIELSVEGGTPGYRFRLNDTDEWRDLNVFLDLGPGEYVGYVRDANGCDVQVDGLFIEEPDPLSIDLGDRLRLRWGDSIRLAPIISGGTMPVVSYRWGPSDSLMLSCVNCPSPWLSPNDQTTITLEILDQSGCLASDQVILLVEKDFPVLVPTGFSPNEDRNNDVLIVHGMPGIRIESFVVIDRWGEVVFEREDFLVNDPQGNWDGSFRGQPLNAGVYLWQATVRYPDGNGEQLHGETTLIR